MKRFSWISLLLLPAVFSLSACFSLSSDIEPPTGSITRAEPVSETAPTQSAYYPLVPPNPSQGQALFIEKCAPCHGDLGLGNGPKSGELPNPVAPIGDPAYARNGSLSAWYEVVTVGRIDRYMPGFTSLSDRQRWDVVAYAMSLSTTEEEMAAGADLYQANCAVCHGPDGQGDGEQAAALSAPPANLADYERMAQLSAADIFGRTIHPPFKDMPSFETTFTESERWALTTYVRSLIFAEPGVQVAIVTEPATAVISPIESLTLTSTEEASQAMGLVSGVVVNASGAGLAGIMDLTLFAYEDFQEVMSTTVAVAEDGTYAYLDPDMKTGRVYIAAVEYNDVTFTSDIVMVESDLGSVELPVQVYETTTDQSAVMVDRLHIFLEFVEPGILRVAQLFILSNADSRVVIPQELGAPVLTFSVPEAAVNLQFQDGMLGDRYIEVPGGFGDTTAIFPGVGQQQILFSYDLPYDKEVDFTQQMNLPVNAAIIMLPDQGVKFKSPQFQAGGTRTVQDGTYLVYNGGDFSAGSQVDISLTGEPSGAEVAEVTQDRSTLLIGLGALGAALILAGVILFRQQRLANGDTLEEEDDEAELEESNLPDDADPDSMVDAIIALDEQYKAGQIPEAAYIERRAELKAHLQKLMKGQA